MFRNPLLLVCASAFLSPTLHAIEFAHEVMPILKTHCAECHTGQKKKGGLAMNTRAELLAGSENGEVVVPGDASASWLIELIESTDEVDAMPPKGPRVSPDEIATLKKWINAGLPWEPGVTLGESAWEPPLRPRVVALPPAQEGRDHPVDRILDAHLKKHGEPLPPVASDAAFLRRATLDAIGLLPTPEDLAAFLADTDPDKKAKAIDSLLADDVGYADHWLTTWNDLLRNDYTGTGFITKGRTQITTWLYAALRENLPFDQFVRELIAPPGDASAGFINGIKWRGDVNASQTREIQFSQNISQVFLGINMKCASCHDSFIDRWKLSEAYNLAAIFSDAPLELNRCDKPIGVMATPRWIFPELGDVDPQAPKAARLQQLADLMTHPQNGRFTRTVVNRMWERLMGRGIVHPVDAMDTKPWNEDLLDVLAVRFAEDDYDLRKLIRLVMTSQAYQSQSVILEKEPGADYSYAGPIAKRMTAEQFVDSIWQITGTHPAKAEAKVNREISIEGGKAQVPPVRAALVKNDFLMRSLGRPHRDQVVTTRPKELTTLQAIDLANGDILAGYLTAGAKLLASKATQSGFVDWLYQYALARLPTADERAVINEVATQDLVALEDVLWLVFMQPEFQIIR
tara:strand:+ start:3780 stop:5669 length:1890 start_codon:yes stop_codon:yes gene_type:complete